MSTAPQTVAELRAAVDAGKAEARAVWQREFGIDITSAEGKARIQSALRSGFSGATSMADAALRFGRELRSRA